MQNLITAFRVFITYAILLGAIYPFFIISISRIIFPYQSSGSLLERDNKIIGSALIAQEFISSKYFHSRYSAINYNAEISGGSNLAPSSKKLLELASKHINQVRLKNYLPLDAQLPADIALESASGLDPHISFANAIQQLPRVAKFRKISINKIKKLIRANSDPDFIGIWGETGVNILKLNLALDKFEDKFEDTQE